MSRGEQAAEEVARRWSATMQAMADQLQRQQQAFQQIVQRALSACMDLFKPSR